MLNAADSGYFINVLPLISWKRGWAIPQADMMENSDARVHCFHTAKQLKLREEHKPPGEWKEKFKTLTNQARKRQALLEQLDISEKEYYEIL